jgi:hypothetical protein
MIIDSGSWLSSNTQTLSQQRASSAMARVWPSRQCYNTVWNWGSFQTKSRPRSWVVGWGWWADGHHAPAAGGGVWGGSSYYSSANKMVSMRRVFCASFGSGEPYSSARS